MYFAFLKGPFDYLTESKRRKPNVREGWQAQCVPGVRRFREWRKDVLMDWIVNAGKGRMLVWRLLASL